MNHRVILAALTIATSVLTASAQTNAPASVEAPPYVLGPNDVLVVKVYREEDMDTKVRVAGDGTITLPLLNAVQVGGKTVEQARALIRDRLARDFLVNPQVNLTVEEFARKRFTVLGRVQKPGTYEMPKEQPLNLLQAIAFAGGFTPSARETHITVYRQVKGRKEIIKADVKAMALDPNAKPLELWPEDTITVPEATF